MIKNIRGSCKAATHSVNMCCVFLIDGHPKICNLRNPFLIKQIVPSLDVTVLDNTVWCVFMEIKQCLSNANYVLKPLLPVYISDFLLDSASKWSKPLHVK